MDVSEKAASLRKNGAEICHIKGGWEASSSRKNDLYQSLEQGRTWLFRGTGSTNGLEEVLGEVGEDVREKPGHSRPCQPRVGFGHYPECTGNPGNVSSM